MFFFTPLSGVLFTFPSRYCFAIGHTVVFSLTSWSRLIHTGFHLPRATRDSATLLPLSTTGLLPSLVQFSVASSSFHSSLCCPTTPFLGRNGLGWSLFARRYWGNRFCFLFLWLLRCFNSPGSLVLPYLFRKSFFWVAPFGHLRLIACFPLPGAFRRSPRPSSPLCAKVSTVSPL
jgi:hypothetical protein